MGKIFGYLIIGIIVLFVRIISGSMDDDIDAAYEFATRDGGELTKLQFYLGIAFGYVVSIIAWPFKVLLDITSWLIGSRK